MAIWFSHRMTSEARATPTRRRDRASSSAAAAHRRDGDIVQRRLVRPQRGQHGASDHKRGATVLQPVASLLVRDEGLERPGVDGARARCRNVQSECSTHGASVDCSCEVDDAGI